MMKAAIAAGLLFFALAAAPVQAEPTEVLEAPGNLSAEYDAETHALSLSWLPPDNTTEYVYQVYEDAVLLANTTLTNLTTNVSLGLHVYWVTATNAEGVESRPSLPVLVLNPEARLGVGLPAVQLGARGGAGGECEAIIVIIDDEPPFVDPGVQPECLPPLPCESLGAVAGRGC